MRKESIELTMRELDKYRCISQVLEGLRTVEQIAEVLGLSERQVRRLIAKVKEAGPAGIRHGNRNHKPSHTIDEAIRRQILQLKQKKYKEANFQHFRELLEEQEGIVVSYTFLHQLLVTSGIKSPKKHKPRKIKRTRKRRRHIGELVQADATPYAWFSWAGDSNLYSLHGFMDDASGSITGLYMCEHECLFGYLEVTRQMVENFGLPAELYPDRHSVFFPTKEQKLSIEEELAHKTTSTTQFGRIMQELGIWMHPAYSSEAKGRIERLWETLQSRLPVEFELRGIKTIEEANKFLVEEFIPKFNQKFSVPAASSENMFVPIRDYMNLDLLLAIRFERTIDRGGNFTYKGHRFQVLNANILPNARVTIHMSKRIGIIARYKEMSYEAVCIEDLPSSYSSLNLDKHCKEHSAYTLRFIDCLMGYDAKRNKPLLTSE